MLQEQYLDKYGIEESKFSDFVCLEEPRFEHSVVASKKQSRSKGARTEEELELIREAKRKVREARLVDQLGDSNGTSATRPHGGTCFLYPSKSQ